MSSSSAVKSTNAQPAVDKIWFTRCPVPTATGLAYKLGWLTKEFEADGISVSTLQEDAPRSELSRHHYDHELATLIREGGNLLAIPARAQGAPSRLVGLTWIDEGQSIIVRPDSGITDPSHLKGKRVALPAFVEHPIPAHARGSSIGRGMALAGFRGALASVGLTLADVRFVEVEVPKVIDLATRGVNNFLRNDLQALVDGKVDAVYVKGAAAVDSVKNLGLTVGIDIDKIPDRRFRVNNGTPRPITVHESLIEDHFELVARFLFQSLRAAEWAKTNLAGVHEVLQSETRGSHEAVSRAYREGFHLSLAPDLSQERVELFRQQKNFQLVHGILDRDFDFDAWIDYRPLAAAHKLLAERGLSDK
jgi:ABC-type nitrate/sulfonate/bicarbonate transport system substrate-binding protein